MPSLGAIKSLTALAALAGLAGLSLLPLDHMHREHRHDRAHHSVTVHRHAAPHPHSLAGQALDGQEMPGMSIAHAAMSATDDEDSGPTLQVFFRKGPRAVHHQPVLSESDLHAWFPAPPDGRRLKMFRWRPPPHGPPFDPARPLRAPPVTGVS